MARDIVKDNPGAEELAKWSKQGDQPLGAYFNSRGRVYRELGLKERLAEMSEQEQLDVLGTDGLLIRRPLLVGKNLVLVGFNQAEWEANLV